VNEHEPPVLAARDVHKRYGAVVALSGASLELRAGEVMALVGDNGAGKSTLLKIIAGVVAPDAGEFTLNGHPAVFRDAATSLELGIETVYQDLALVDTMSAVENVFLGRESVGRSGLRRWLAVLNDREMKARTAEVLDQLAVRIQSLDEPVSSLSGGQRQALAIARAVLWGHRLVLLDEPTASLGVEESRHVLDVIRRLKQANVSVVVVSHNLQHVFDVADRITVLRRGQTVGVRVKGESHPQVIVGLITGGDPTAA
jgi:ABC-type sugar transport system ATPase subunit